MRFATRLAPLLISVFAAAASAQSIDAPPVGGPSKLNADRLRWVQYKMVAGRLAVTSTYPGTNMTFGPAHVNGRRRERLEIHITPASIDLQFELTGPDERLAIVLDSGKQFSIQRVVAPRAYELSFEQNELEPLSFRVAQGNVARKLRADSFWHLYLMDPSLVGGHLVPLLEILHPSWQLASIGASLERMLTEQGKALEAPLGERWLAMIDELASAKFSERTNAQRALRAAGHGIMPFLKSLDRQRLDAEQAARVRELIDSLSGGYEDSAERVAPWLAGDARAWMCLLDRAEPRVRRLAADQLRAVTHGAVAFDPDADEATRRSQLERVREQFDKVTVKANAASNDPKALASP